MGMLLDYLIKTQPDFRKARLPSLYSDFSAQRASNPDGYNANVKAWESALAAAAKAGVLTPDALAIRLDSKLELQLQTAEYGRPQGLAIVEEESVANGNMLPLTDFLQMHKGIYDHSWDVAPGQVPVKVLSWVLRQAGILQRVPKDPNHQYVQLKNLEDTGNALAHALSTATRRTDRVLPMKVFRSKLGEELSVERVSDTDLSIMLKHLARDKGIIAYDENVVKLKAPGELSNQLSTEDKQICSLKTLIEELRDQADSIAAKIDELTERAKEAVTKNNKTAALRALRSRKVHEDMLTKRSDTLMQLESVFNKIEEAADQIEVVKAMQGSTDVLRSLNKASGGVERVEDIVDQLQDEMAKVEEVSSVINDHGRTVSTVDESEIDQELEQMEEESKARQHEEAAGELLDRLKELKTPSQAEDAERLRKEEPSLMSS